MAHTLQKAGCPCNPEKPYEHDFEKWEVTSDGSLKAPVEGLAQGYKWYGVEVISPAFYLTEGSLQEVIRVTEIIKSTYLVNINDSCGLHVHVGVGDETFTFPHIRNLHALLYAFSPQLNSLHPARRETSSMCIPLRSIRGKDGRTFPPMEGVVRLLLTQNFDDLYELTGAETRTKMSYNFNPIFKYEKEFRGSGTVEFRQHEGTLDGEAIRIWIKTVVRLVEFARELIADPTYFTQLLNVLEQEDVEGEPPLCESEYTIIDFLKNVRAWESVLYYKERGIYKVRPIYYYPDYPREIGDEDAETG